MAHVVEETFDIKVYNKMQMLYLHKRIGHCHGIFLAAVWAKPKAAVVEFRFANGFQNLQEALLDKPVLDSRDSQETGLPVVLCDFHPAHGLGDVPFQPFAHITD